MSLPTMRRVLFPDNTQQLVCAMCIPCWGWAMRWEVQSLVFKIHQETRVPGGPQSNMQCCLGPQCSQGAHEEGPGG